MAHDPTQRPLIVGMTTVQPDEAAQLYAPLVGLDPERSATPESIVAAGPSFRIESAAGQLVFTVSAKAGRCWIHAARGSGRGMTEVGLNVIEQLAKEAGCSAVGFQTVRRGLLKKAQRLGYRIAGQIEAGHILEKSIT